MPRSPSQTFSPPFSASDFQSVFDRVYNLLPISPALSSIGYGTVVYGIGLTISAFFGFHRLYLDNLVVRHVAFASGLALLTIAYGKQEFLDSLASMRPCFMISDDEYVALLNRWMSGIFSSRGLWSTWAVVAIAAIWGTLSAYYSYGLFTDLLTIVGRAPFRMIIAPEWFMEPRIPKLVVLDTVLLLGAIPLSFGIWGVIKFGALIREILTLPVIPLPNVLLIHLRRPTGLFLRLSFVWFVLSVSSGLVLFDSVSTVTLALGGLIGSVGIVLFFLPQYAFHDLLTRSHLELAGMAAEVFHARIKNLSRQSAKDLDDLFQYCAESSDKTELGDLWVFNIRDIFLLILGQLLSLTGVLWQSLRP